MRETHLLLIVNTSTCWKAELHLLNLVSCTVCYMECHDLNSRIDVLGLSHLFSWYEFHLFTDGMGPFKSDLLFYQVISHL